MRRRFLGFCAALAVAPRALAQQGTPELASEYRGIYATINMNWTDEQVRALTPSFGTNRRFAINLVQERPATVMPPVLYALASTLAEDYAERAIFWYHVGRIRAVYDGLRCRDKTAQVAGLHALRKLINQHLASAQHYRRDRLVPLAQKAIDWDAANPRDYDQRWIALYGDVAKKYRDGDPGEIQVPESEWPGILAHVHDAHLKSVQAFAAVKPS